MSKRIGASDAFQEILQKMDETFIQAEFCLRSLREDALAEKTNTKSEHTITPASPVQSERSCSPAMSRSASSTGTSCTSSSSSSYGSVLKMKSKGLVSLDRKQAVILTKFKSNSAIPEKDVKAILKLINDLFDKKDTSSAIDSSSASFMTL